MSNKLTRKQAIALGLPVAPVASKYHAIPTEYKGVRYASKAEAHQAEQLDLLKAEGVVRLWIGQPKFRLGCPENVYVADFLVVWKDGFVTVQDVKGHPTAKFRRDVKLWVHYGECPLQIYKGGKLVNVYNPIKPKAVEHG